MIYLSLLETDADRDVFQKFYEENEQLFFLAAMKYLHNEADAEDAVQSCFLKMIDNFASYRDKSNVDLARIGRTIIRHNAIDILRDKQKKADFTDEFYQWEEHTADESPDILDMLIQKYEEELVTRAIMLLTPDERGILWEQYALGHKPKDIAENLGMTSLAVRKKALKSRQKLAKILEGFNNESL